MTQSTPKIRFGIVGTSFIVDKVMAAAKQDPRFELTAVYSRTQARADQYAQQHNIAHTFTSLAAMAASDTIDAVYIASPNSLHASQSILCMQHGKHVLCEKPFASTVREAHAMIGASRIYNTTLMEAMMPPHTPSFASLAKHVKEIGTVRRYFASFCKYSSRYDNLKQGVVMNAFDPKLSSGALMDLGVYCIYPMILLFGRPKSFKASAIKLNTGVDGQGSVDFEYEGMQASIMYSKISDSHLGAEIQGEDAVIHLDHISVTEKMTKTDKQGIITDISAAPSDYSRYYYEIKEFIDTIQAGKIEANITTHDVSLATIEIMEAIRTQIRVIYPADGSGGQPAR